MISSSIHSALLTRKKGFGLFWEDPWQYCDWLLPRQNMKGPAAKQPVCQLCYIIILTSGPGRLRPVAKIKTIKCFQVHHEKGHSDLLDVNDRSETCFCFCCAAQAVRAVAASLTRSTDRQGLPGSPLTLARGGGVCVLPGYSPIVIIKNYFWNYIELKQPFGLC